MDTLSQVLECVRCDSASFTEAEFGAHWNLRSSFGRRGLIERVPPGAHIVGFCFVVEGRCKIQQEGSSAVDEAVAGDLLLFLGKNRYLIGSDLRMLPLDEQDVLVTPAVARAAPAPSADEGAAGSTRIVFCSIACSPSMVRALLESMPPFVRIPGSGADDVSGLRELLRIGVLESRAARPGVDSALARLSELVLVDALRRYAENVPPDGQGWLAASRDERIGRALALMHAEPHRAWTLDELARSVALSRSALADRFARLVGQPPMRYLTRWRLALAAQTLRSGAEAIVRIAERAGYDSDAAFSRAFQREFGMPPARWRRGRVLA